MRCVDAEVVRMLLAQAPDLKLPPALSGAVSKALAKSSGCAEVAKLVGA